MIEYQKQIHEFKIFLRNLHLTNFRLFQDLNIKFHSSMNVLIGINGAGKTSVLDAIANNLFYLAQGITNNNQDIEKYQDTDIRNKETGLSNELILDFFHDKRKTKTKLTNTEVHEDEVEYRIRYDETEDDNNEVNIHTVKNRKNFEPVKIGNYDILEKYRGWINRNIRENHEQSLPVLLYFKSDYTGNTDAGKFNFQKLFALDVYENSLDNMFDLNMFFEWFKWQGNLEKTKKKNHVKYIQNAIYEMLSDEHSKFRNLYVNYEDIMQGELIIEKNGDDLKINQLSSGEKRVFVMAANLAFRLCIANPDAKNPLHGQGVVLIDEIDLHLHPQWQRKIVPQLQKTFPNIQFVVTTHSPLVLSEIKAENMFVLENGIISNCETDSFGLDINTILEEVMVTDKSPIEKLWSEYFTLISQNKTEELIIKKNELLQKTTADNPLFVKANALMERKKLLGK